MAKGRALCGKIVGRLGSNVFRIQDGEQIISEYRPHIINPKSDAQTMQRAKFALSTSISKQLPYVVIAGWSPRPSVARSAFLRSALNAAQLDNTNPQNPMVAIAAEKLVLSSGRTIPIVASTVAANQQGTQINFSVDVIAGSNLISGLFVAIQFDVATTLCDGAFWAAATISDNGTTARATVAIGPNNTQTGKVYQTYFVPIADKTGHIGTKYGDLRYIDARNEYAARVAISLSKDDLYGQSAYLAPVTVIPN